MSRKRSDRPKHRRYDPLAVLAYVATYQQNHRGRSPSERQIQAALGISAPSVAHMILRRLEHRELLTITRYERGQSSDLLLTAAGDAELQRWQGTHGGADAGESPPAN